MVTLALIGLGNWGKNYISTISSLKECNLKYICAESKTTLNRFPDSFVKYTNYKSLLKHKDISGVIIATPPKTHFKISKVFLEKGFNLLIEKPLAINLKEADILKKISKSKINKIMIGNTYLFNPAYRKLKRSLKRIGNILEISFEGSLSIPRKDVSVIWDWGPHPISILMDLLNDYPKKIKIIKKHFNKEGNLDTLVLNMYIKKVKIKISISWSGKKKVRKLLLKGDKGELILDDINESHKKLLFINYKIKKKEFLKCRDFLALTQQVKAFVKAISNHSFNTSNIELSTKVVKLLSDIEILAY